MTPGGVTTCPVYSELAHNLSRMRNDPTQSDCHREPSLPSDQDAIRASCVNLSGLWQYTDPYLNQSPIHELVARQVNLTPNAIAIVSPTERLTYLELERRAATVAQRITLLNLPSDRPVGIFLPVGVSQIVSMLAVMKAGHFMLCLAPTEPVKRNLEIISDLEIPVVITDGLSDDVTDMMHRASTQSVDIQDLEVSLETTVESVSPSILARVALSSGSTGKHKVIKQTHAGVTFGCISRNNAVHLATADKFLCITNQFTEIWRPLIVGASLNICDLRSADWLKLHDWACDQGVTALRITPTVFRNLVDVLTDYGANANSENKRIFPTLRVIEFMGEPMPSSILGQYHTYFSKDCVLINNLGSKEVLDYCAYYINHDSKIGGKFVPCGFPTAGASVQLLSENGDTLGPGKEGAIVVQTESMSPGYWAEKKLPKALCGSAKKAFYVTGDRGYFRDDGCMMFVGRRDSIIKIRGHQVHMLALEDRIKSILGLSNVAITTSQDTFDNQILVAYLETANLTEQTIRDRLSPILASYEMPSVIKPLKRVPKTGMGKIDRSALREITERHIDSDLDGPHQQSSATSESSNIEVELKKIWSDILHRDQIGINDDFLQLGGHSLMVMRVINRIRDQFDVEVPILDFVDNPTISALVNVIQGLRPKYEAGNDSASEL